MATIIGSTVHMKGMGNEVGMQLFVILRKETLVLVQAVEHLAFPSLCIMTTFPLQSFYLERKDL